MLQATRRSTRRTGGGVARTADGAGHRATELTYEHGVELKARSQWAYARMRFFRHKLAVVSLVILIGFGVRRRSSRRRSRPTASTSSTSTTSTALADARRGWHLFGTDQLGRDYLSRVIYGIRTSLWVAIVVALLVDVHRHGRRLDRRLLRREDGQPADALHRPHPHAAGARGAPHRRRVLRPVGQAGRPRHHDGRRSRSRS